MDEEPPEILVQMSEPSPFPIFVASAVGFVILLVLTPVIGYYSDTYYFLTYLSYMFLILSLVCLIHSLLSAINFNKEHRGDYPQLCKTASLALVGMLIAGPVIGGVVFTLSEPYNDWQYSASLRCTFDCVADLPVPVMDLHENLTFFDERDIRTSGQGFVEVLRQDYDGERGLVLRVHWSGNFTLKVSRTKDYRALPLNVSGLYDEKAGRHVVLGHQVPTDGNVTFSLEFEHKHISQVQRQTSWDLDGRIIEGINLFQTASS